MTINKSCSSDYSPMRKNGLPVENGGKSVIIFTDKNGGMDAKVNPSGGEEEESEPCGWRSCQPKVCQRFRKPGWMLFWLCWAGAIQGMVVNGFINVVISTVERRYDMSSTESGIIASCYDIASALCLIPVSYFGGLGCKPRYLGIGIFIMALGSFVFSLPKFTTGDYHVTGSGYSLCSVNGNNMTECDNKIQSLSNYKYVFYLGQLLHGAGAAPLYTLGVTYLDENLPLRSSSMYIGLFYAFAIVGPAVGYLAGGAFLELYVDLDKLDSNSFSLKSTSPRWVGAWWIGFLFSGFLALLVSVPICGFPKILPGSSKYQAEKEKEVYKNKKVVTIDTHGTKGKLLRVWSSVKVLLTNPTFMFLNLAAAAEGNLLAGFATFAPKFIEAQFALQSSTAAMYIGYAAVPAGGGGTFLGGYLVKRFNLGLKGIIRLCLGVTLPCFFCMVIFLVTCDNVPFAGVNINYEDALNRSKSTMFLGDFHTDKCNTNCHCSMADYNPVCGNNDVMYYSACFAGCQNLVPGLDPQGYGNCSCISTSMKESQAVLGKCGASSCGYLLLFLPIFAIVMLLTFVASMPALTATLRCVPHDERSFALGIQWIIARCLGSIPGPILFGKLIDITCKLWQNSCGEQGSCFFYDNRSMSYNMMAIGLVGKFLSSLFFFLALVLYKSAPCDENSNSKIEKPGKLSKIGEKSVDTLTTSLNDLGNGDIKHSGVGDIKHNGGGDIKHNAEGHIKQNGEHRNQDGGAVAQDSSHKADTEIIQSSRL